MVLLEGAFWNNGIFETTTQSTEIHTKEQVTHLSLVNTRNLEDLTIMLLSHCLQRNLLVFHESPQCAAIIRSCWFGSESHQIPIPLLYDNRRDHFSGLKPRWSQMKDLSQYIIQETLPEDILIAPSELGLVLSRYVSHKERD